MQQAKRKFAGRLVAFVVGLLLSTGAWAQQSVTVNGTVKDVEGEPIMDAIVRVVGLQGGTATDANGNFTIVAPAGSTLRISYIGYETKEVTAAANVAVTMEDAVANSLQEAVVIGYGVVKKSDLTGSVTALRPDSKNKGVVVNPQDMLTGKVAGVSVTSNDGTPGGGSTIRIRGGSSLNASNDPLIVIDGVAMDNNGVKGLSNALSMVNPQDIESFNILKDASATAIYGSRGSNGVIIITTKKGRKGQVKPQISYSGNVTVSTKKKSYDVLNGDEFRALVKNIYGENSTAAGLLGSENTDWQKQIFRTAVSTDHNVTVAGSIKDFLPYRVSLGYTGDQGILKTSKFDRYTAALNLNPSFLNDHLTLNLNAKGMWAKSQYANSGAVGAATFYDPTQPVTVASGFENFGGYYQWLTGAAFGDAAWPTTYNTNATANPLALLELKDDRAISRSFIGSADIDYKVHGFEDLRLHMTLGLDVANGKQWTDISPYSSESHYYGSHGWDRIVKRNQTLSAYAQYYHDFNDNLLNHIDVMAGYEWSHFWRSQRNSYWGLYPSTSSLAGQEYQKTTYEYKTENYLVSFFGRLNYSLLDRYYLTFTLRDDGSSRFKDHWELFPSLAFAWKIKEEPFAKDLEKLSDLKLRLGWGKTGQQDGIGDYNYFAVYSVSSGNGSYYPISNTDNGKGILYRPTGYNPDLKWEVTTTYNIGLDWGVLNQRLSGTFDWYYRKTTDLICYAPMAMGTNFVNAYNQNIGSLRNTGFEAAISWKAIQQQDLFWVLDYNLTYNSNKITKITGSDNDLIEVGGIGAGTGSTIQAHTVGKPANSFYVYQQVYDENGQPLEGVYVDRNGDGVINASDKYFYKSPWAPVTMGFGSRLEYKNWDFGFNLRASIGNYVYNDAERSFTNMSMVYAQLGYGYLSNRTPDAVKMNWQTYDGAWSDYFVHNASFLKCDNITVGYSFAQLFKTNSWDGVNGRVYATVNNVFTITKYNGLDPEVFGGIDSNMYPRPFSFIFGVNLNF